MLQATKRTATGQVLTDNKAPKVTHRSNAESVPITNCRDMPSPLAAAFFSRRRTILRRRRQIAADRRRALKSGRSCAAIWRSRNRQARGQCGFSTGGITVRLAVCGFPLIASCRGGQAGELHGCVWLMPYSKRSHRSCLDDRESFARRRRSGRETRDSVRPPRIRRPCPAP